MLYKIYDFRKFVSTSLWFEYMSKVQKYKLICYVKFTVFVRIKSIWFEYISKNQKEKVIFRRIRYILQKFTIFVRQSNLARDKRMLQYT